MSSMLNLNPHFLYRFLKLNKKSLSELIFDMFELMNKEHDVN